MRLNLKILTKLAPLKFVVILKFSYSCLKSVDVLFAFLQLELVIIHSFFGLPIRLFRVGPLQPLAAVLLLLEVELQPPHCVHEVISLISQPLYPDIQRS